MAEQGYIQLTRDCNQNCLFCSNPANENKLTMDRAIALIDDFIQRGYSGLIFTGGEPTLCPFLPDLIAYATRKNMPNRIITNGQRVCDPEFFGALYNAGLRNVNLSLYSVRNEVQAFLSGNDKSLDNIITALEVMSARPDMQIVVNTVINKYNSDHLSENVRWLLDHAPFVTHIVWNNLDPGNNKCEKHPDTIPTLNGFEVELHKAVHMLIETGRTCRIERVPLCYMTGFEHLSTETRKIVKRERTTTFFLDEKELFSQDTYQYGKASCCSACFLDKICAGLFEMDVHYSSDELYACFIEPESIVRKILGTEEVHGADMPSRRG